MNIVVRTQNGSTVVRPDITWERYNRDFYVPEFVGTLFWTPVIYAPVSRPGKFIQNRFADRYIASPAYGILFYPDVDDPTGEAFAQACCLTHSSLLPEPYPEGSCEDIHDDFLIWIGDSEVFHTDGEHVSQLTEAVSTASQRVLLRNGDIVALEIGKRTPIDGNGKFHFTGKFREAATKLLDFQVII